MVLQPLLELAFILDQKMRKQKKTTRKRKNLRLRLPEQQFDAVSCQLSSSHLQAKALGPPNSVRRARTLAAKFEPVAARRPLLVLECSCPLCPNDEVAGRQNL